ncbi:winged helix-turn-helix domain-containing protein [Devosia nitrariae]|uniref:OmpR/PhoB-type domain-containing protein n=1 Tax=Devosia nitrariae TaxID=2071872 RepID=A0ABQ5WB07_9HYPH|nr:winged helix-turn-helix domain-containing protein [Devosia nitrariae]GLQ57022.1 hypothetical protein GCM10010862_42810 [Devosia nitrariae]
MQDAEFYRFGDFVLDTARMALFRDGSQVELRPKAFETLLTLLRNAGRVVTKDELVASVWPSVIVNDDALAQCVRDIRKALDDPGQTYIRTVPRRGYMFASPVETGAGGPVPVARRRLSWWLTGAVAVVAALAVAVVLTRAWTEPEAPGLALFDRNPRLTIAVLPFRNDSGSETDAWVGAGLAEDILTGLARFGDLTVISRNSSFRDAEADPVDIGRQLNADLVLQGSVRQTGDTLRLSLQLVDPDSGTYRWVGRYEERLANFFTLQDTVTQEIAYRLALGARDAVVTRVQGKPPEQLAAYELVLRGRNLWRRFTREDTLHALDLAERAVEMDPGYAVAWELLAQVLLQLYIQPYNEQGGDPATLACAREAAERAVALDPGYAAGQATLGAMLFRTGAYDTSIAILEEALRLNPNDAGAITSYANILGVAGLNRESLRAWDEVERLDPLGPPLIHALRSRSYVLLGEFAQARAEARACVGKAPGLPVCHLYLVITAQASGETEAARQAAEGLLALNPQFSISEHFARTVYRNPQDPETLAAYLRAAGLPE